MQNFVFSLFLKYELLLIYLNITSNSNEFIHNFLERCVIYKCTEQIFVAKNLCDKSGSSTKQKHSKQFLEEPSEKQRSTANETTISKKEENTKQS